MFIMLYVAMCYVSSYIMILIHFNYLYRDIIVYRDKLSTNYRDKKISLSPKPIHDTGKSV